MKRHETIWQHELRRAAKRKSARAVRLAAAIKARKRGRIRPSLDSPKAMKRFEKYHTKEAS
ncbi:MAG: hypothetical protein GTN65_02995 [Armatimonadetes bacterium]|nr:hypothetical protein [Armatimonadota bacterium]NIO96073.1 hypothetical protein [Armatimonadota bacterium]